MDAAENEHASFFQGFQRGRNELARRSENDGGIQFRGRRVGRFPGPDRAELKASF